MRCVAAGLAAALLVCLAGGCGDSTGGAKVAKATGTVTYNGSPVANAKVMFHPVDGGSRTSYGTTDESGKFEMRTFGLNDGALVGKSKVTITLVELPAESVKVDIEKMKREGAPAMPGYEKMMGIGGGGPAKPKYIIPEKYADKDKSGIEVDVVAGEPNDFSFDVKD